MMSSSDFPFASSSNLRSMYLVRDAWLGSLLATSQVSCVVEDRHLVHLLEVRVDRIPDPVELRELGVFSLGLLGELKVGQAVDQL